MLPLLFSEIPTYIALNLQKEERDKDKAGEGSASPWAD